MRGLLRFDRVNKEDMSLIADMIGSYLNSRNYGNHNDDTIKTLIEATDYYTENKLK